MIARVWRGRTRASDADKYLHYLEETGVKEIRETPGNLGIRILRKIQDNEAEFVFVSFWDSYDSIRKFAGPDAETAVYFPEDDVFLLEKEPHVHHFECWDYS